MKEKSLETRLYGKARARENQRQVWQLYVDGLSVPEVVRRTGLSHPTVMKYLKESWKDSRESKRTPEQERILDLKRLDGMLAKWYPIATSERLIVGGRDRMGNEILKEDHYESGAKAVAIVLKVLERRAKLLGLDLGSGGASSELVSEVSLEELAEQIRDIKAKK